MSDIVEIIRRLLTEGSLLLRQRPILDTEESAAAISLLEQAYAQYRQEIAGPPLAFASRVALAAAALVCRAGWLLLVRSEPPEVVEKEIQFPEPVSAAQHLSADLMLRFL